MREIERKKPTSAEAYAVLDPHAFMKDITLEAANAKHRVWMQAMYMRQGVVAQEVCSLLLDASARGINTRLHTDWFGETQYAIDDEFEKLRQDITESNVSWVITNKQNPVEQLLPYLGRNHMKLTIIDDKAYIGGVNYGDEDFLYHDFMVKVTDKPTVKSLAEAFMQVEYDELQDSTQILSPEATLIIDAGTGNSPILEAVVESVRNAKKNINFISQFVPDGAFLEALKDAHTTGVTIEGIVPLKNEFSAVFNLLSKINLASMELSGQSIPLKFIDQMVHAKMVLVDDEVVTIGSHNMTERGVQMRTAEIALQSKNKALIRNTRQFYDRLSE